ncbi:hypothetical protein FE257_010316 [Aspergillus nanangensis]|uniref:Ubiquitin-like protease family profile domain-containing protein n=1 Tax=Aspergillus nanangensis TaxID=2582783 RepID=A0AAD4GS78_ASPNN|nr:hypothetical protein FE257_010316 [Aspergillus nanangensis]
MQKDHESILDIDLLQGETSMHRKPRHGAPAPDGDERRLFPNYGAPRDSVPIVPGQATRPKKKLQNIPSFKPVDMLSRNTRDSGPIRARGKTNPTRQLDRYSSPKNSLSYSSGHTPVFDSERPVKRQRRESLEAAPARPIILSDDDVSHTAPDLISVGGTSARRSSLSSQLSAAKARKSRESATRHDEFRAVEDGVKPPRPPQSPPKLAMRHNDWPQDDDKEELFTNDAARQRRAQGAPEEASPGSIKRSISNSVDGLRNGFGASERTGGSMSPPRGRTMSKSTRQWSPDIVESSDELQGDSTVPPAPTHLSRQRSTSSTAKLSPRKQDKTARRRRSQSPKIVSSKARNKKAAKKNSKTKQVFQMIFFRMGTIYVQPANGETADLSVGKESIKVAHEGAQPESMPPSISFKKINRVCKGDGSSRKISIELSKSGPNDNRVDVELLSPKIKDDLCDLFLTMGVKVQTKLGNWMDNSFQRKEKHLLPYKNGTKRPSEDYTEEVSEQKPVGSKRARLSDMLQDYSERASAPKNSSSAPASHSDPLHHAAKPPGLSGSEARTPSSPKTEQKGVEIPVKKYDDATPSTGRATRSMSRREQPATVVCDDEDDDDYLPTPRAVGISNKWHRPLVYPRFGKKKAEVDAQDRDRLREHEFLNDNLIGFYIRFLEDHWDRRNKEVAKKVYFFNSYFFATLTNGPRSKRAINYEGVEKWTRNVDLFSYDYIVVPINENAHWYVAIICNLPELQRVSQENETGKPAEENQEPSSRPDAEVNEVPETPEPSKQDMEQTEMNHPGNGTKEESTRQRLASMSLSDTELPRHGDAEWPVYEENPSSSPAKFHSPEKFKAGLGRNECSGLKKSPRRPGKQKRKPPVKKHDINQPIIITFDSLNLARSPTISTLREYLYAESNSKRGIEIDKTLIKGMKARDIPLQPNYSDCGLYLLAYVEKFVQAPGPFIKKLLRKEMDGETDWPPLRSGLLRTRLRNFLDDLYDEQLHIRQKDSNEKELMVDQHPISYLLGPSESDPNCNRNASASSRKSPVDEENSPAPRQHASTPLEKTPSPAPKPECTPDDTISGREPEHSPPTKDMNQPLTVKKSRAQLLAAKNEEEPCASCDEPTTEAPVPHDEVVEVPDSQEPQTQMPPRPSSPPKVIINHETLPKSPKSRKKTRPANKRTNDDGPHVSDANAQEVSNPDAEEHSSQHGSIEIQITEPPSSATVPAAASPVSRFVSKKSSKSSKHRP